LTNGQRHHAALTPGYKLHWYEIESILGQGGFGITYLATDTNLDTRVAIKEFLPNDLAVRTHESTVEPISDGHRDMFTWGLTRFLTESKTLARFQHPNIVRVNSGFEANNTAYMVMEYVEGQTLEDALKFHPRQGGERRARRRDHRLCPRDHCRATGGSRECRGRAGQAAPGAGAPGGCGSGETPPGGTAPRRRG